MARTVEIALVDTRRTARPEALGKHDPSEKRVTEAQEVESKPPRRKRSQWIFLLVAGLAVAGAAFWWLDSRNYESTDDAQIEGHLDLVSARISGTVSYINARVENNQFVEAG